MTTTVFAIILFAATLHATWNAIVKSGTNTFLTTILVTSFAAFWSILFLPFFPTPHISSWPYILASTILNIFYFIITAKAYRFADMSQVYPLMRGTAPILVAIFGTFFLGEKLGFSTWLGIIIICSGILLSFTNLNSRNQNGVYLALLNACIIAAYTLIDGHGIRLSASVVGYSLWIFLLLGLSNLIWALLVQYNDIRAYAQKYWHLGAIGGIGIVSSYGIALWAMTVAPIAIIAALRETSILFATLIALFVLKEKMNTMRILSACVIVCGAIVLRLSF